MYVDKVLTSIKAVQTLSRLNRAHPKKHDVFVLDFQNDTETIEKAFADYYRTTSLSKETDPNKLHTLKNELDAFQVYSPEKVDELVELYLAGAECEKLDPILNACVAVYLNDLNEDGQVNFKGKAKAFVRTYDFLATILPYGVQEWEKLSIFLNFLIPKLPAPIDVDLSKGILECHRYGQLPRREKGDHGHRAARRQRGDRACSHQWRRPQARAGNGQALEHHQGVQR
jgi:type I restriction enzyme R subunit